MLNVKVTRLVQQHGLNGWPNGGMVPDNCDPVGISKAINEFKQSNQGGILNGFQNGGPGMAPNHGPGAQETHGGNLYGHPANGGVAHPLPPPPHPFGPAAMYASQLAAAAAMSAANHPYMNPMAFYQVWPLFELSLFLENITVTNLVSNK